MTPVTVLAWIVIVGCFAGFIAALRVGEDCATNVGPYLAAGMFIAWIWLAYQQDRKER